MDSLTLLFLLLGGICGGTYPVPIKDPAVLEAQVHPVVFQCYKSAWVFITGLFFLIPIYLSNPSLGYQFNWWAIFSAVAWIPSGTLCIAAVPRIGVATTTVANSACATILSFFVGWLVLSEAVRQHTIDGVSFYLAPLYIVFTLLGMGALTYSPAVHISASCERAERRFRRRFLRVLSWFCCFIRTTPKPNYDYRSSKSIEDHSRDFEALTDNPVLPSSPAWSVDRTRSQGGGIDSQQRRNSFSGGITSSHPPPPPPRIDSPSSKGSRGARSGSDRGQIVVGVERVDWAMRITGIICAAFAGIFSASQYALVNLGSKYERDKAGCGVMANCPPALIEAFNNFGSWMVTFGVGALSVSLLLFICVAFLHCVSGRPVPSFHFKVMVTPGSAAGVLWCLGNFFNTAAVVRGGNAIVFPQILSVQLLTCGCWGLFYYQEVQGMRTWLWILSALFTLASIILLGFEKV